MESTPFPENIPVWDDGNWPGLPPLQGDLETDVCVVGLGGSGLACALELLDLGQRVVGLEAKQVASGAARRNGGFLLAGTAAFHHDAVRRLGRARARDIYALTLRELQRMERETPKVVRQVGSLRIAASPEELDDCQRQLTAMREDDFPVEPYAGLEGEGLLFPEDAVFNPLQRCRILAARAGRRGAHLFEDSPAVALAGNEVLTPNGRVRCRAVIVAVDGGLEHLLPELQGKVRAARLQMLATAPTDEVCFPRPVYARYGYEYYQQLPDGRLALGGFRDQGGEGEWTSAATPSEPVQKRLTAFLREALGVKARVTHRWAATVGYRESVLPLLAEVRPNLWAIGGYNGTGNVIGALCGRGAAQMAVNGSSAIFSLLQGD
jgi:glycine/D-amino acid oxidase-like deaminating enzyme